MAVSVLHMNSMESLGNLRRSESAEKEISSFRIFTSFLRWDENGECDASEVLGRQCYLSWLASRRCEPKNPHEAFRRAVTAHIRGNDGRRPFSEEAETSLLKELRKKRQWKAFEGTDLLVGIKGFSSLGHHEKRKLFQKPKRKGETSIIAAQRNVRNRLNIHTSSRKKPSSLGIKRERVSSGSGREGKLSLAKNLNLNLNPSPVKQLPFHSNKLIKVELDDPVFSSNLEKNLFATHRNEMDSVYPSKSCSHECLCLDGLDSFNPMLDEMIDLCDEDLDGPELANVFDKARVAELLY